MAPNTKESQKANYSFMFDSKQVKIIKRSDKHLKQAIILGKTPYFIRFSDNGNYEYISSLYGFEDTNLTYCFFDTYNRTNLTKEYQDQIYFIDKSTLSIRLVRNEKGKEKYLEIKKRYKTSIPVEIIDLDRPLKRKKDNDIIQKFIFSEGEMNRLGQVYPKEKKREKPIVNSLEDKKLIDNKVIIS